MARTKILDAGDIPWPDINPQQARFVCSRAPYICGAGGMGSGKTTALVWKAILMSCNSDVFGDMSGNYGIIGRYQLKSFKDTTYVELKSWLPSSWIEYESKKDEYIQLYNGSRIQFVHYDQRDHLTSLNIGWAAMDQMEEIPEDVWKEVAFERIRKMWFMRYNEQDELTQSNVKIPFRTIFGVCNPRRGWIYDRFVKNEMKKTSSSEPERKTYKHYYRLIQIPTLENVKNLPSNFVPMHKENLTDREYARNIMGAWDAFEGQIYTDFTDDLILDKVETPIPTGIVYLGIDHGGTGVPAKGNATNITAVPFISLEKGIGNQFTLHVFDELWLPSSTIEETIAAIDEKLKAWAVAQRLNYPNHQFPPDGMRLKVRSWKYDPAMNRKKDDSGESIAETYMHHGLQRGMIMPMTKGENEIAPSIHKISWLFRKKRVKVNPNCVHFIESHRSYHYGDNDKPALWQDDHECDAFKLACSGMTFWQMFDQRKLIKEETREARQIRISLEREQTYDPVYGKHFVEAGI